MAERVIPQQYIPERFPVSGVSNGVSKSASAVLENTNNPEAFVSVAKQDPALFLDNPRLLQRITAIHLESVAEMHQNLGLPEISIQKNKEQSAEVINSYIQALHGPDEKKVKGKEVDKAKQYLSIIMKNVVNTWDNLQDGAKESVAKRVEPMLTSRGTTVFDATQLKGNPSAI